MGTLTLWRHLLFIALLAIGTSLALAVVHHVRSGPPVADHAILELNLRALPEEPPTLGPYSRFGWHHPGPMMYYLFAPGYWASGAATWSLHVGAALLSMLSLLGTLAILRRHLRAEALALLAVTALTLTNHLSAEILTDPWNPYIALMPFLLGLVLAAEALRGDSRYWPALIVIGSFLVQTHIGYGPIVATLTLAILGTAVVLHARGARKGAAGRGWSRRGIAVASLLVVLSWAPPVYEQMTQRPGNLERIVSYLRSDRGESLGSGGESVVLSRWCAMPLYVIRALPSASPHTDHAQAQSIRASALRVCAALQLVLIAGACLGAVRRTDHFLTSLAVISLCVLIVALLASQRIQGPQLPYLYHWIVPGGYVGWASIVGSLLPRHATTPRSVPRCRAFAAAVFGVGLLLLSISDAWDSHRSSFRRGPTDPRRIAVAELAGLASVRAHARGGRLTFDPITVWPIASGLLLELDKRGLDVVGPATHPDLIGPSLHDTGDAAWQWVLIPDTTTIEPLAHLIGGSNGVRLIETEVPDLVWGSGWLPAESWGRWVIGRSARLYLSSHSGGMMKLEYSGFESMHTPQSVEVVSGEGETLARFDIDGVPWQWNAVEFHVPPHTRVLEFRCSNVYRHRPSGRYYAFPVRNLRYAENN